MAAMKKTMSVKDVHGLLDSGMWMLGGCESCIAFWALNSVLVLDSVMIFGYFCWLWLWWFVYLVSVFLILSGTVKVFCWRGWSLVSRIKSGLCNWEHQSMVSCYQLSFSSIICRICSTCLNLSATFTGVYLMRSIRVINTRETHAETFFDTQIKRQMFTSALSLSVK